eukprot:5788500-Prymnesium_polylepis.3
MKRHGNRSAAYRTTTPTGQIATNTQATATTLLCSSEPHLTERSSARKERSSSSVCTNEMQYHARKMLAVTDGAKQYVSTSAPGNQLTHPASATSRSDGAG